jgi:hypothetical protein
MAILIFQIVAPSRIRFGVTHGTTILKYSRGPMNFKSLECDPEVVHPWDMNVTHLVQDPFEQVRGIALDIPVGSAVGGVPLDHKNRRFRGPNKINIYGALGL